MRSGGGYEGDARRIARVEMIEVLEIGVAVAVQDLRQLDANLLLLNPPACCVREDTLLLSVEDQASFWGPQKSSNSRNVPGLMCLYSLGPNLDSASPYVRSMWNSAVLQTSPQVDPGYFCASPVALKFGA